MAYMVFKAFLAAQEGVLLPDKPAAPGLTRLNPFPTTLARLRKIVTGASPARRKVTVLHPPR